MALWLCKKKCPQVLEIDTEVCKDEVTNYLGFAFKYFGKILMIQVKQNTLNY